VQIMRRLLPEWKLHLKSAISPHDALYVLYIADNTSSTPSG
jgi:hypothetical protein